jgi:hypothetical protein
VGKRFETKNRQNNKHKCPPGDPRRPPRLAFAAQSGQGKTLAFTEKFARFLSWTYKQNFTRLIGPRVDACQRSKLASMPPFLAMAH